MIIVFCELGGEGLLGKAREIADSAGSKVLALISEESVDPQRLIHLGADEVLKSSVNEMSDWIEIISDLITSENKLKDGAFSVKCHIQCYHGSCVFTRKEQNRMLP